MTGPRFGRRPSTTILAIAAVLIVTMLAVLLARASGETSSAVGYIGPAILGLLAVTVVFFAVRDMVRMFSGTDPDAAAIADRLAERPEQRLLVTRWLRRSRRYRYVGGTTGVVAGMLGGGPGGAILIGLIGLTVGSLLAEVHLLGPDRLDRPAGSDGHGSDRSMPRRTAGLDRRSLSHYWETGRQVRLAAVGAGAALLVVADGFRLLGPMFRLSWAVAATVAVLAAFAIQWRVATRPRPALPQSLRSSDDLVRSLAITNGIVNPALSLALAFVGQSLSATAPVVSVVAWLAALSIFWRYRRLGLDWLLDEPPLGSSAAAAA